MLKYFGLLFIFLHFSELKSQINPDHPPGTIKLTDSLFIDKTPVTNLMYIEFLNSKERFWSEEKHLNIQELPLYGLKEEELQMNKSITTKWDSAIISSLALEEKDYLLHPEFQYHPVLNITKAEAEEFCLWRTDMVMLLWAVNSEDMQQREQFPELIQYRLPKASELNKAQLDFEKQGKISVLKGESPKKLQITENPDEFYLYNISEFTEGNNVYGSNWQNKQPETFPNRSTGFRCVCEIKKI